MEKGSSIITRTKKRVLGTIGDISLEGVERISASKLISTFEITSEVNPRTNLDGLILKKELLDQRIEKIYFDLREIQEDEIEVFRKKKIPSFVLKKDGKYFYAQIPKNMNFTASNILGEHLCTRLFKSCKRFSPVSDEKGGCKKVRDRVKRIERYSWITEGYEVFNTNIESLVVVKCEHYVEKCQSTQWDIK